MLQNRRTLRRLSQDTAAAGNQAAAAEGRPRGRRDGQGEDFGRSGSSWVKSPDGQWEAMVKDHNIVIRAPGKTEETPL